MPFVAGQLLHRRIGDWLARNRVLVSIVDQGSVLLVVYVAFSTGVTQGLWTVVPVLPLMIFHLIQLLVCAVIANRLGTNSAEQEHEGELEPEHAQELRPGESVRAES